MTADRTQWAMTGASTTVKRVHTMRGVQAHRGYRGWLARSVPVEGGRPRQERVSCSGVEGGVCFHQKQSAAKRCAEQMARLLNAEDGLR